MVDRVLCGIRGQFRVLGNERLSFERNTNESKHKVRFARTVISKSEFALQWHVITVEGLLRNFQIIRQ